MQPDTNSTQHLDVFLQKLKTGVPFCFIRPNDGEYLVMTRHVFTNTDNWHYNGRGTLTEDLKNAIRKMLTLDGAFVGIPCKGCSESIYTWYMNTFNIPTEKLTYGNICCNKNWKPFMEVFTTERMPFYYIGPYKANYQNLNIQDVFTVDEFLVHNWDTQKEAVIQNVVQWVSNKTGIFVLSIGPIAKVLIPILFELYPKNTFMDVGSAFDLYIKGRTNRMYINSYDTYGSVICDFNKGHL